MNVPRAPHTIPHSGAYNRKRFNGEDHDWTHSPLFFEKKEELQEDINSMIRVEDDPAVKALDSAIELSTKLQEARDKVEQRIEDIQRGGDTVDVQRIAKTERLLVELEAGSKELDGLYLAAQRLGKNHQDPMLLEELSKRVVSVAKVQKEKLEKALEDLDAYLDSNEDNIDLDQFAEAFDEFDVNEEGWEPPKPINAWGSMGYEAPLVELDAEGHRAPHSVPPPSKRQRPNVSNIPSTEPVHRNIHHRHHHYNIAPYNVPEGPITKEEIKKIDESDKARAKVTLPPPVHVYKDTEKLVVDKKNNDVSRPQSSAPARIGSSAKEDDVSDAERLEDYLDVDEDAIDGDKGTDEFDVGVEEAEDYWAASGGKRFENPVLPRSELELVSEESRGVGMPHALPETSDLAAQYGLGSAVDEELLQSTADLEDMRLAELFARRLPVEARGQFLSEFFSHLQYNSKRNDEMTIPEESSARLIEKSHKDQKKDWDIHEKKSLEDMLEDPSHWSDAELANVQDQLFGQVCAALSNNPDSPDFLLKVYKEVKALPDGDDLKHALLDLIYDTRREQLNNNVSLEKNTQSGKEESDVREEIDDDDEFAEAEAALEGLIRGDPMAGDGSLANTPVRSSQVPKEVIKAQDEMMMQLQANLGFDDIMKSGGLAGNPDAGLERR